MAVGLRITARSGLRDAQGVSNNI